MWDPITPFKTIFFGAMCGETLDRSQMTLDCDRIGGAPAASIRLEKSGSQDGRIRG